MRTSETIPNVAGAMLAYMRRTSTSRSAAQEHLYGAGAVAELEDKLKRHYGTRFAVCVSNATTGLLVAQLAMGLRGKEIITTPLTYGASLAGMLLLGNMPAFADVESTTLGLAPASVQASVTRSTAAVLAVDMYGNPSDTAGLRRVADEYGIWYIADAAQSLGARRQGVPASSMADALVVSFTAGKTLFAGEGGAVLTNSTDIFERLLWYSQHPNRQKLQIGLHAANEFCLNGRIHPLAALWANADFDNSMRALRSHQKRCLQVTRQLNACRLVEPIPFEKRDIQPSFFQLSAAWRTGPKPQQLREILAEQGCRAKVIPGPVRLVYEQPAFRVACRLPVSATLCRVARKQARKRFLLEMRPC